MRLACIAHRENTGHRPASVALALVLVTGVARADEGKATFSPSVAEVTVQRAAKECFASLVHASGYLVPRNVAVVMFNASGFRISEVSAKVGDTVNRGDVVAHAAPLVPPSGGSQVPADVPIKSLASGSVLQGTAFAGEVMSQKSDPLFTLAVDGEIEASVNVPSVHVAELETGQAARLTTREGAVLAGHLRLVPVTVDPANQMGETRISLDGDQHFGPGRFVRATIEARRSCNIGVPHSALRRTSTGMQVEVVEKKVVATRIVQVGLSNESDTEIVSGLAEGDLVISNIGSSLRDGDQVRPIFSDLQDAR